MMDRIDENLPMTIPEQAAEWLLRWHCGDLTIAERFQYLQWLKTSPVHIAETLRMCRLYSWLENAKLELFITNEDSFTNVVELSSREREAKSARGSRSGRLWRVPFAAGLAVLALGTGIAFVAKTTWLDHTLHTRAGEWRSVPLSDGSSISAAPKTKLRHAIDEDERLIKLAEGSAVFRVARDPSRPFLVDAGVVVVKATGTQFTVERHDDQVRVTMREGSVVVSPSERSEAAFDEVPLEADDQLTVSGSGAPSVAQVDAERSTQRVLGRLTFGPGDTIEDAVAQFNGVNAMQIVVDDATGSRPMRGSFDAIDPLSFAASVERITGGTAVRESSQVVRIGSQEPPSH